MQLLHLCQHNENPGLANGTGYSSPLKLLVVTECFCSGASKQGFDTSSCLDPWCWGYCSHLSTAHHLPELAQKGVPHSSKRNWSLWIHLSPFTDIIPCSVSSLMSIMSSLNSPKIITEHNTASFTHHLCGQRSWRTENGDTGAPVYLEWLFSPFLSWQSPGGHCLWACLCHPGQ